MLHYLAKRFSVFVFLLQMNVYNNDNVSNRNIYVYSKYTDCINTNIVTKKNKFDLSCKNNFSDILQPYL